MKTLSHLILILFIATLISCDLLEPDTDVVKGEQSPIGKVGEKAYVRNIPGVNNFTATVTSLENGISTYKSQVTVNNTAVLNILKNIPEFTVVGNTASTQGLKFKITTEGIESLNSSYPGVLVNYNSKVGDTYKGASGYKREVISKSTDDDYPFGSLLIKVLEIEESPCSVPGVKKLTYYANHKFGIVGAVLVFDDNSQLTIGFDYSTTNK